MHDIQGLERDGLNGGTGDMSPGHAARQAHDGPAGVLIPVGRAEPGKGGHEKHAAVVPHRGGKGLNLGGVADDLETVAQPLHHRPGDEHAALKGVAQPVAAVPAHRGEQVVLAAPGFSPGVHEKEAPGPVGVLRHARKHTGIAVGRGLLIPGVARQRKAVAKEFWMHVPHDPG